MDPIVGDISVLGNGDSSLGEERIKRLALWLQVARIKHPGSTDSAACHAALLDELDELRAETPGTPAYDAELMDIITVAWRMLNREYAGI